MPSSNPQNVRKTVLLIAAEPSSELYARRLIEEVRRRGYDWHFVGIGSQAMRDMGMELVEETRRMAVMGLVEIASQWQTIATAFRRIQELTKQNKFDLAILLDYPGFNLRLAKFLHGQGVPVDYYVSPQVWAWKKNRVHLIKRVVTKMLCVLPFEVDFYKRFGISALFVGHPLCDEVRLIGQLPEELRESERERHGVERGQKLLLLLPGSRESEVALHINTQVKAAEKLVSRRPECRVAVLVAPHMDVEVLRKLIPKTNLAIRLIREDSLKALQLADAALVASGTATLVTALAGTPQVIMYRMHPLTAFLARIFVRGVKFFGLANLILDRRAFPEYFQGEAKPDQLAADLEKAVFDPEMRTAALAACDELRSKVLGPKILADKTIACRVVDVIAEQLS